MKLKRVNRGRKEGGGKRRGWCDVRKVRRRRRRGVQREEGVETKKGEKKRRQQLRADFTTDARVTTRDHQTLRVFFFLFPFRQSHYVSRPLELAAVQKKKKKVNVSNAFMQPLFYFPSLHHTARMMGCKKKKKEKRALIDGKK